ncbi:MAG: hypothetical protein HZB50_10605 [Chloroflexi bacterium]|nr:hypothetical protein [Chloroflexota bacterium]
MRKIIIGILIFALTSCTGNVGQTPQIPPTNETVTAIVPDSETESSPLEDTDPTPVSENTSESLFDYYDLPAWMKDPDTNIVAALITDDYEGKRKIAFFNAITGEKYEILMPQDISGYFWFDNENFGLLSKDLSTSYQINLPTGQVSMQEVSQETTRLLNQGYDDYENGSGDTASELVLLKDSLTNNPVFERAAFRQENSKSGLFTANWTGDYKTEIEVIDTKTNQVVWKNSLANGMYGIEFAWSPNDEGQLAYLQGKPEPTDSLLTESILLTIVDVTSGEILSSYSGDFGIIRWSHDGNKILYQNAWSRYVTYGFRFKDAPCILFLNLGEKRCLRSIPRFVPEEYELVTTGVYSWGIDDNSIYYTYIYASQDNSIGNLCIYSLLNSHINCPTQNLDAIKGMTILNYEVSPGQQYVHFCYSGSSILNDYAGPSKDGIIKTDGTGFFSWVGAVMNEGPQTCSNGSVWRPLP